MDFMMAMGEAIKRARLSRQLTQEDFSRGSSRTYMSSLERGLKRPTVEKLNAIAKVMEIHPLTIIATAYLIADRQLTKKQLLSQLSNELDCITT